VAERDVHIRHLIDLALESPILRVAWVRPGTESERVIRPGNGVAFLFERAFAAPAICTMKHVAKGPHEKGHHRSKRVIGTLASEILAWEWAREHALYRDWQCHAEMKRCLRLYMEATRGYQLWREQRGDRAATTV
jgi:hypothetical protein